MTVVGTAHFVSIAAAVKYYEPYGYDNVSEEVSRKIETREIHIGPPKIKQGQILLVVDDGTRYAIKSANQS